MYEPFRWKYTDEPSLLNAYLIGRRYASLKRHPLKQWFWQCFSANHHFSHHSPPQIFSIFITQLIVLAGTLALINSQNCPMHLNRTGKTNPGA